MREIASVSKMSPDLYTRKIVERNVKLQAYVKHLEAQLDSVFCLATPAIQRIISYGSCCGCVFLYWIMFLRRLQGMAQSA